nr:MAG: RNA-dependent RNA polymerase [Wufeng shrew bunyavirus 3]
MSSRLLNLLANSRPSDVVPAWSTSSNNVYIHNTNVWEEHQKETFRLERHENQIPGYLCIKITDDKTFRILKNYENHGTLGAELSGNCFRILETHAPKLPHDMVMSSLDISENQCDWNEALMPKWKLPKLTPDVLFDDGEILHIMEIKTHRGRMRPEHDSSSLAKYLCHLADGVTEKPIYLSSYVVTSTGVLAPEFILSEFASVSLMYYTLAQTILETFDVHSTDDLTEAKVTMGKFLEGFREVEAPGEDPGDTAGLWIDESYQRLVRENRPTKTSSYEVALKHVTKLLVNRCFVKRGQEETGADSRTNKEVQQLILRIDNAGARTDLKSVVQMPLCLCEYGELEFSEIVELRTVEMEGVDQLVTWIASYLADFSSFSEDRRSKMVVKPMLPEHLVHSLSIRGIDAKRDYKMNYEKQDADRRSRQGFKFYTDTSDVQNFVMNTKGYFGEVSAEHSALYHDGWLQKEELIEKSLLSGGLLQSGKIDTEPLERCIVKEFINTEVGSLLYFFSSVIEELNYSRLTNLKAGEFLVKPVKGYKAFLIIKPTQSENHLFFTLCCKGQQPEWVVPGVFKQMRRYDDWLVSDVVSIKREKIETYLQSWCKMLIHFLHLANTYREKPPNKFGDYFAAPFGLNCLATFNMTLLTFLEDKQQTSTHLQYCRYLLMHAFESPENRTPPACMLSKFDPVVRSRLCLFLIKRSVDFCRIYDPQVQKPLCVKWQRRDEDDGFEVEGIENSRDDCVGLCNLFTLQPVCSFEEYIQCTFVSHLHNKNTDTGLHGDLQIFRKIMDKELEYRGGNLAGSSGYYEGDAELKQHEFDLRVMDVLALRVKRELRTMGYSVLEVMSRKFSLLRLCDLATMKCSANTFILSDGDSILNLPPKMKCHEALLMVWPELEEHADDLLRLVCKLVELYEQPGRRIMLRLFRKQQIGGPREIFIQDIRCRIITWFWEQMARSICEQLPNEMLTKGNRKLQKTQDFLKLTKRAMVEMGGQRTVKEVRCTTSADATNWCQGFTMKAFYSFLSQVYPDECSNLLARSLNLVTRKGLLLPEGVCKIFLQHPEELSYSDSMNRLKKEFLGQVQPEDLHLLHSPGNRYIRNNTNFMQGILHYTSSLLHAAYLMTMEDSVKLILGTVCCCLGLNARIHTATKCSSDDSSMVTSVLIRLNNDEVNLEEENLMLSRIKFLSTRLHRAVQDCYPYFCAKSSSQKSIVGVYGAFEEFNSEFYVGNTLYRPVQKFINPLFQQPVSTSLEQRCISSYQSLSTAYENGLPFLIGGVAHYCQAHTHYDNLGLNMSWLSEDLGKIILRFPHPKLGFFVLNLCNASGLFGFDKAMLNHMNRSHDIRNLEEFLASSMVPSDFLEDSMDYSIWFSLGQGKKYREYVERTGESLEDLRLECSKRLELLLGHVESIEDQRLVMRSKLLSRSLGDSFIRSSHAVNHAAGVYLLLTGCMDLRASASLENVNSLENSRIIRNEFPRISAYSEEPKEISRHVFGRAVRLHLKCSFLDAVEVINHFRTKQLLGHNHLTPRFANLNYSEVDKCLLERSPQNLLSCTRKCRKYMVIHKPEVGRMDLLPLSKVALQLWFGIGRLSTEQLETSFLIYKKLYPWLRSTKEDTMRVLKFESELQLATLIKQSTLEQKKTRVLGTCHRAGGLLGGLGSLIRFNQWQGSILVGAELAGRTSQCLHDENFFHNWGKFEALVALCCTLPGPKLRNKFFQQLCHKFEHTLLEAQDIFKDNRLSLCVLALLSLDHKLTDGNSAERSTLSHRSKEILDLLKLCTNSRETVDKSVGDMTIIHKRIGGFFSRFTLRGKHLLNMTVDHRNSVFEKTHEIRQTLRNLGVVSWNPQDRNSDLLLSGRTFTSRQHWSKECLPINVSKNAAIWNQEPEGRLRLVVQLGGIKLQKEQKDSRYEIMASHIARRAPGVEVDRLLAVSVLEEAARQTSVINLMEFKLVKNWVSDKPMSSGELLEVLLDFKQKFLNADDLGSVHTMAQTLEWFCMQLGLHCHLGTRWFLKDHQDNQNVQNCADEQEITEIPDIDPSIFYKMDFSEQISMALDQISEVQIVDGTQERTLTDYLNPTDADSTLDIADEWISPHNDLEGSDDYMYLSKSNLAQDSNFLRMLLVPNKRERSRGSYFGQRHRSAGNENWVHECYISITHGRTSPERETMLATNMLDCLEFVNAAREKLKLENDQRLYTL